MKRLLLLAAAVVLALSALNVTYSLAEGPDPWSPAHVTEGPDPWSPVSAK